MHRYLLMALLVGAAPAAADTLDVVVTDEDGALISDLVCGIADARSGDVRLRFRGSRYAGAFVPRAGDRLHVYRRGFDLGVVRLEAGQRRVVTTLVRSARRARIVLDATTGAASPPIIQVLHTPAGRGRRRGPVEDTITIPLKDRPVVILLPRGMETSLLVRAPGRIAWPVTLWPRAGRTHAIRLEPVRELAVVYPADAQEQPMRVLCLPDVAATPDVDPRRVDAWRWHLNGPDWLAPQFHDAASPVRVCPNVAFHLFAEVKGLPVYRFVRPEAKWLDLSQPRLRAIAARPVVAGVVVAEGTVLSPGRLDLYTVAALIDEPGHERHFAVVGPRDEPWRPVHLPAAGWLTIWDRDHGIAHARWPGGRVAAATFAPGRIDLAVPAGWRAAGTAAAYPVWKGAGTVRTMPPDAPLRRPLARGRARFAGLPLGHYAVRLDVVLTNARGERVATRDYVECTLDEKSPVRSIKLPLRPRRR